MSERRNDGLSDVYEDYGAENWRHRPLLAGHADVLQRLYDEDGVAATIVDRPAEDALASGFEVEGDEGEEILNEYDRLGAEIALIDAVRLARLTGGGVLQVISRDAALMGEALDLGRIEEITELRVFPATALMPGDRRYDDPKLPEHGRPETYWIQPQSGEAYEVHETRLIKIPGEAKSWRNSTPLIYWRTSSALERCAADLERYRDCLGFVPSILEMKQQAIAKLTGLDELLRQGLDSIVKKRLNLVDQSRSIFRSVAVDASDDFGVTDNSLSGIDTTVATVMKALVASSQIHGVVLFGEESKGLGVVGAGQQAIYHGLLKRIFARQYRPALERLLVLIWAQRKLSEKEPKKWRIKPKPLYSPTAKEEAEVKKIEAEEMKISVEAISVAIGENAVNGDELRVFMSKKYADLGIDDKPLPEPDPPPLPPVPPPGNEPPPVPAPPAGPGAA